MDENKVLATVAGVAITNADIDNYIMALPQQQQAYIINPQFREQVLEQLIAIQLFAQKGREDKLEETEEYAKILEEAKGRILAQMVAEKVLNSVTVSDEEIAAHYEENKSQFGSPESVGAKHILVDTEEKCQEIMAEINAGAKTFEEAAAECSNCPSKAQGGDLGKFTRGQMVPEFDQAAFDAEVDVIVGPVKTQFGYHLIKVYEKNEAGTSPLEEVAAQIKQTLTQSKQSQAYDTAIAELKAKYME